MKSKIVDTKEKLILSALDKTLCGSLCINCKGKYGVVKIIISSLIDESVVMKMLVMCKAVN